MPILWLAMITFKFVALLLFLLDVYVTSLINFVDHAIIVPLLACSCRLIALDKDPGVRPILVLVRLLDELLLRLRSLSNNSISYWC